jgi:hypothetical protein
VRISQIHGPAEVSPEPRRHETPWIPWPLPVVHVKPWPSMFCEPVLAALACTAGALDEMRTFRGVLHVVLLVRWHSHLGPTDRNYVCRIVKLNGVVPLGLRLGCRWLTFLLVWGSLPRRSSWPCQCPNLSASPPQRLAMSGFFHRIANYLANELIVKGLSQNRTFQQFALRTAQKIEQVKGTGVEHGDKITETVKSNVGFVGRFFKALGDEVRKDINKISGKR